MDYAVGAAAFQGLLTRIGATPDADIYRQLVEAYTGSARHYHNISHIDACLAALNCHGNLAERPDEIAVALWFHDAVYDTHRNDNEAQSAKWARRCIARSGGDSAAAARIHDLIMATQHDGAAADLDAKLMVDIDLGILGQSPGAFSVYDAAIRREYHWLADAPYRTGRLAVLRRFLARPSIYSTDRFIGLYEGQARMNLENAMSALQRDMGVA